MYLIFIIILHFFVTWNVLTTYISQLILFKHFSSACKSSNYWWHFFSIVVEIEVVHEPANKHDVNSSEHGPDYQGLLDPLEVLLEPDNKIYVDGLPGMSVLLQHSWWSIGRLTVERKCLYEPFHFIFLFKLIIPDWISWYNLLLSRALR